MSLSMRALVDRKVTNKITQLNNRMVEFNKPIIYYGDANVNRNLSVGGILTTSDLNVLNDLIVERNIDNGGHMYTNNLMSVGDASMNANLFVGGDLLVDGVINPNTFLPGQTINTVMAGTDSGLTYLTSSVPNSGGLYTKIFNYSYTPKYSYSYLIIEYNSIYSVVGNSTNAQDNASASLNINYGTNYGVSTQISKTQQLWLGGSTNGTGTRSGTMLPIIGRYTNSDVLPKNISVSITTTDDLTVYYDISTWLKITEIGR